MIPDKSGGAFPLSGDGYKISSKMRNCDQSAWTCSDTIMVRYKVKPKTGTSKNYVFENIAVIKDDKSEEPYKSNRSYPLKLAPTTCVPDTQCSTPTQDMCGGSNIPIECSDEDPCSDGFICQEGECVDDPAKTCLNSAASFDIGKNSPISESSEIVIPKDNNQQPLTVGQFTVHVTNCEDTKLFNINAVTVHVDYDNDHDFKFSDLELIHDLNGDGVVDPDDKIISTGSLTKNYVKFFIPPDPDVEGSKSLKKFPGSTLNYFIVRTMVDYTEDEVKTGTTFHFYLESASSIEISDLGTAPLVDTNEVEFASYMLEPTGDFFIATIGSNDPSVPPLAEMNDNIPVLQIRTKAIAKENSISSLKVKVPQAGGYVKFGEKNGIKGISLFLDSNKDGTGNVKLAEITEFDTVSLTVVFDNFLQPVSYLAGDEKHFVVYLDLDMVATADGEDPMSAKIEIPNAGIGLSNKVDPVGLPIRSKEFVYACNPGDVGCNVEPEPDDGGCSCSVVSVRSQRSTATGILIALILAALLGSLFISRKQS